MFHLTDVTRMSSTLVETVSINYEDFNDSFLTCGTCLCSYDGLEHTPKLLPCSHTVCRSCLERIVEASGRDSATFRCPICRETITVPRGGVVAFPPSFLVNQLIDLMAAQRRDIIPKCSNHPTQELMFCETCDTVFCMSCTGGSHNGRGASAHTVIPFSIAIKRMSEILLYKATLCMRNLNTAAEVVAEEMTRLDTSADLCMEVVGKAFEELSGHIERRRSDVLHMVRKIRDEKKKVLREQLDIIDSEKSRVEDDCTEMQHQVEVRNITKKISDLNEKLDISTTLSEPRENSFIQFECKHNAAMTDLVACLSRFGRIRISTTYPSLCTASLERATVHLSTTVTVTTVDYHGNPRTSGSDPLTAVLLDERGNEVPIEVKDNSNGKYIISYTAHSSGRHQLSVKIFERSIKDSPFPIEVSEHNNPVQRVGKRGTGAMEFVQPVAIAADPETNRLFVLDTGNSRIKVLEPNGSLVGHIGSHGMESHSSTGLALSPAATIVVVNWRTKHVTELAQTGDVIFKFTCDAFVEPISVAVNSQREIIVADNGAGCLFRFDATGKLIGTIGSKGDKPGNFKLISMVYCAPNDDILVMDNRIHVFSATGQFKHLIEVSGAGRGQYGGVTIDVHGNYLATRSEKGKSIVQVFNSSRQLVFDVDSHDDKLKRPSGLTTTHDGHVYVVDLGNDCVKKYKYM